MKSKKNKKRKKGLTSRVALFISIVSIILYTIAAFTLQFFTNDEISSTLTTCFFAFFAVEIFNLTSIKKSKIKNSSLSINNKLEDENITDINSDI